MMRLYSCAVYVLRMCLLLHDCLCALLSQAITGLFEMLKSVLSVCLHQPVSTYLRESVSATIVVLVVVLLLF